MDHGNTGRSSAWRRSRLSSSGNDVEVCGTQVVRCDTGAI
jgi:hypothetical protein